MSNCNRGCRGVCRCEHEWELCATAGADNSIGVPCPFDSRSCQLEIESSRLEVFCPCCPIKILEITDPLNSSKCDGCTLDFDLSDIDSLLIGTTAADLKSCGCSFKYKLFVNDQPYLAGYFHFDWSFV